MRAGRRALGPAASLAGGNAIAALIAYAAQPVLSRLYTPEAFGVADLFAAAVAVLVPIGSLRYEDALLLPAEDSDAAHLFWLATLVTLGAAALLGLASLLPVVGGLSIGPWALWLAPTFVVLRAVQLSEAWLTRRRQFGALAGSPVARSIVTTGWRFAGALPAYGATAGSLIASFVGGQAVAAAWQARPLLAEKALRTRPQRATLARVATRYRRFALMTAPAVLFNNLTGRLPIFLLAFYFSEAIVGQFGRVLLTLAVPLALVGRAAGRVFIPDAVAAHRAGTLARVSERFHAQLVWIGLYPALALIVAGPELFAFVFGAVWREAGLYAQWLSPWLLLASVCAPLTALFDVTEHHQRDVATGLLQSALVVAALVAGAQTGSALFTVSVLGAAGVTGRLVQLGTLWKTAGLPLPRLAVAYRAPLLAALPGLILMVAAQPSASGVLVFAAATAGGSFYAWLALRHLRPTALPKKKA